MIYFQTDDDYDNDDDECEYGRMYYIACQNNECIYTLDYRYSDRHSS